MLGRGKVAAKKIDTYQVIMVESMVIMQLFRVSYQGAISKKIPT